MVTRDEITKAVHRLIGEELVVKANKVDEDGANGVQFHGADEVHKVVLGVSLNSDFLREAVDSKAQYCIFHH